MGLQIDLVRKVKKISIVCIVFNLLLVLISQCYLLYEARANATNNLYLELQTSNTKMKNSKLLQQKNCLFKEISLLNSLFQHELDRNDVSNILPKITEENESMKNYNERKRKFETRNSNVEIPLQNFLDFQKEIEILEQETDLAFT